MDGSTLAKWIIFFGVGIIIIGILIWLGTRFGLPFGKLPGDVHVQKEKYSFYFPIVTSIVISLLLTILLNLIIWFFRK